MDLLTFSRVLFRVKSSSLRADLLARRTAEKSRKRALPIAPLFQARLADSAHFPKRLEGIAMRRLIQSRDGQALPADSQITYNPRWKPYKRDPPITTAWRPLANLIRRVRRDCKRRKAVLLGPFRPVPSHILDGNTFPDYHATCRLDPSKYVTIVCDPDCLEDVIYAYGTALE
jgi:hypothetical protein